MNVVRVVLFLYQTLSYGYGLVSDPVSTSHDVSTTPDAHQQQSTEITTINSTVKSQHSVELNSSSIRSDPVSDSYNNTEYLNRCPENLQCSKLGAVCIQCHFSVSCVYGQETDVSCFPKPDINCHGVKNFTRKFGCRFCYQLDASDYKCIAQNTCKTVSAPREFYYTNCTVNDNILCMGRRTFNKMELCNWTRGYRWSTALLLSITMGGFGVDRFYLGLWREGIGKLFSFGGLGVWTLVDVILIAAGYIGPEDGSLYIY
ncbi:TM2 domain-containing protein 3-like [Tubulanus polymorphus]|uniref:TM2 domain-containing protein 3-like n=1 Tax=Tubulanus polymorphus TaxID=672921 RepID=UPI003DA3C8F7